MAQKKSLPDMLDCGFTYSEQHRHACEVRHVCSMNEYERRAFLDEKLDKKRGFAGAQKLRLAVKAELEKKKTGGGQRSQRRMSGGYR